MHGWWELAAPGTGDWQIASVQHGRARSRSAPRQWRPYVVPVSDQPRNAAVMNLGTFVGALCFLAGALLLLPDPAPEPAPATSD